LQEGFALVAKHGIAVKRERARHPGHRQIKQTPFGCLFYCENKEFIFLIWGRTGSAGSSASELRL